MSRPQGKRPPPRQPSSRTDLPSRRPDRARSVPPRNGMSPILVGALIGLAIGSIVVAYLLGTNSRSATTAPPNTSVATNDAAQPTTNPADEPPRMSLADFKALYDNPAGRPVILDVRDKDAYDAGHIKDAISFPQTDVETRVQELSKDKLIVAYCQ